MDLLNFTILFATDGQPTATIKEAADLLELCLQLTEFEGMTLLLDGLDECADASKELMPFIKRISSQNEIRLILLGRSTVRGYLKGISSVEDLSIGDSNFHDIRAYLKDELEICTNDELLPKELDIESTAEKLSRRADGMFLWARLMMTYLALPSLLMSERMEAIREIDMPEGLEIMYERILVQIYKASKTSFKLAAHVFTCLLYGNRSLEERELEDSVVSRKRGGIDEQSRSFPNFVDTILLVCGGFVERSQQGSFRFIHASVHDYFKEEPQRRLTGRSQFHDPILVSTRVAGNLRLATHCLEYNIRKLAQYLNWIITDWSVHLHEDPSCIYDEAAAFIKSEYAIKPSDIAVKKLVSAAPASNVSSEPLHKISKMMPDGKQDYVLSIYPPM